MCRVSRCSASCARLPGNSSIRHPVPCLLIYIYIYIYICISVNTIYIYIYLFIYLFNYTYIYVYIYMYKLLYLARRSRASKHAPCTPRPPTPGSLHGAVPERGRECVWLLSERLLQFRVVVLTLSTVATFIISSPDYERDVFNCQGYMVVSAIIVWYVASRCAIHLPRLDYWFWSCWHWW